MRRLLLLAYYFPPRMAAGSPRATYIAKYLPAFGWQVTVVTARFSVGRPPESATVVETDYTDVVSRAKQFFGVSEEASAHDFFGSTSPKIGSRMTIKQRLVETSYKMLTFPDPQIGWLKHGVRAVRELLDSQPYHALISTSFPYTAHLIARRALGGRQTFWLADLRDPWRGNPLNTGIHANFHAMLERKTLRRANAITTVSEPLAEEIGRNNPTTPTFEIRNAFDPDDWTGIDYSRPQKFRLTYAGSLYQGLRDPQPLFEALTDEFRAGTIPRENVEVVFFAHREKWLQELIGRSGLQDVVKIMGYVERDEVLAAERATSVNLLLLRDLPGESGVYTGKVFEYLGAGMQILSIGGPQQSVVRNLLDRVGGWYATSKSDIRMALRNLYGMHDSGSELRLSENVEQFSARSMAERFAAILENIKEENLKTQ